MIADKTITLYRPADKIIIAQVEIGEEYNIPDDVFVFEGDIAEFKILYPEYREENEL